MSDLTVILTITRQFSMSFHPLSLYYFPKSLRQNYFSFFIVIADIQKKWKYVLFGRGIFTRKI